MRRILLVVLVSLVSIGPTAEAQSPMAVDPADLVRRADLLGKEMVVDDRLRIFNPPRDGIYDEFLLKRAGPKVVFRLPPTGRLNDPPKAYGVQVQGILRKQGEGFLFQLTAAPNWLPKDLRRVEEGVALLNNDDAKGRQAWADWAARRSANYDDEPLRAKVNELRAEALAIEAEKAAGQGPDALLALAEKARTTKLPEPEPSALAHQAFRAKLAKAQTAEEFQRLAEAIAAFLPGSIDQSAEVGNREFGYYEKDPAGFYRKASPRVRSALDRRLWADAEEASLTRKAASSPKERLAVADQAKRLLRDRPEVAVTLRLKALEDSAKDVTKLRQDEMLDLARMYREEQGRPDLALALIRTWLDDWRDHRLSKRDADDRVTLANEYYTLLKDKQAARQLLESALALDPGSKDAEDLFRKMGFKRQGDAWVSASGAGNETSDPASASSGRGDDPLLGLTPTEVKNRLGKPNHVSRVVTQGGVSIQWVYGSSKDAQYIDFLQKAREPQPTVVGHFHPK